MFGRKRVAWVELRQKWKVVIAMEVGLSILRPSCLLGCELGKQKCLGVGENGK